MKHFKEQDVRTFLQSTELAAKPLPDYVQNQMGLVKEYLAADRYYSYSDDGRVWSNGNDRHKGFQNIVGAAMGGAISAEEKDFLQRLLKGYGHFDEKSILPELSHPELTKGGKTMFAKYLEKYGVSSMEDVHALDQRLEAAHEMVETFIKGVDLDLVPGMSWIKYLIYRDESIVVDKALKEALLYHQPLAINNVLHDQIGRFIDRNWYELSLLADWYSDFGPSSMVKPGTNVYFGKVHGHDDLMTIEFAVGKKGFKAMMRKR